MHNQASLEGSVSLESLIDHLTQVARRMHPEDPSRPYGKVARLVFNAIFNDGRPHEAIWLEADAADTQPYEDTFRFRLVSLIDSDSIHAVTATDEAILLYLRALNTDLADQALALKLLVEIQMQAGEFDKALDSARQATRTARALSASLRERLVDTHRDVGAVDWDGAMPRWLSEVQAQISQQIERDRQLLDLAAQSGDDPAAQVACQDIADEVRTGQQVWTILERHLQDAIPTFLRAQSAQRFNPRGLAAAIDMSRDVFEPALSAPDAVFHAAVEVLVGGVFAPPTPVSWGLGEMTDLLFKPPTIYDRKPPEIDEPGELGDAAPESIPHDIAQRAAEVLAAAAEQPTRLSELLAVARADDAGVEDPDRLQDVLWGASLWLFASGGGPGLEDQPATGDLAGALAALTVSVDEQALTDDRYLGPDLTLARSVALDLIDMEALRASS